MQKRRASIVKYSHVKGRRLRAAIFQQFWTVMTEIRFGFGKNWEYFLGSLDEERVVRAEISLKEMLGVDGLRGRTFLDVGCGSGLFSLAAMRLGAKVTSFDYDPDSVECAKKLKTRFFAGDESWKIMRGDALDREFVKSLGRFDIVYSWGVLHHTGKMWEALRNVSELNSENGVLFISLYNDQGFESRVWKIIKRTYNVSPDLLKPAILTACFMRLWTLTILRDALKGSPLRTLRNYGSNRGMSAWRDLVDWVGGYPFETAKPDEVEGFFRERGFKLSKASLSRGSGCNEFVFLKQPVRPGDSF